MASVRLALQGTRYIGAGKIVDLLPELATPGSDSLSLDEMYRKVHSLSDPDFDRLGSKIQWGTIGPRDALFLCAGVLVLE
jgi:hypothetical protein